MLTELAHYLTTPVPRALRRLGYLRESVFLLSRSRRCRAAWADHLAAARDTVARACEATVGGHVAVILGSGLLDDVPLALLAATFREVRLVDAVHMRSARRTARAYPNVRLVTAEISGSARCLAAGTTDLSDPLADLCGGEDVDLVVSANLLSQLPIVPLDWFAQRRLPPPPDFGRRIVEAHLDGLARLSARVCLVADLEQIEEDRDGRVIERLDLLHGLRLPPPDRAWTWELAPFGEAARHRRHRHRVHVYDDWRSVWPAMSRGPKP